MERMNYNYIIPIVALLGSIIFLTPSLTGNVVLSGIGEGGSSLISIILLVVGMLTFLYFKHRSERKV